MGRHVPGRSFLVALCWAAATMTPSLVPLHVASHTERLPAARVRTFERLLARVRMAVNLQARGSRERFVTRLADIPVLRLPSKSC